MGTLILNDISGYDNEIQELKIALRKTKNVRMHKRYSVLLRHFEGFTNKKIAEMEDLEPHAVGNYIKNYKLNGLAGLEIKHSNGAKRKFNIDQESKIFEDESIIRDYQAIQKTWFLRGHQRKIPTYGKNAETLLQLIYNKFNFLYI